ncbi:MAG: Hint domain-containing protein [Bdellovibrionales bacterium]
MKAKRSISFVLFVFVSLLSFSASAENLAAEFSWKTWENKLGGVKEWGNIIPETGINHLQHTAKNEIYNAVARCGVGKTNYELIRSYRIDFNGDGILDYILDPGAYFAQGTSDTCPFSYFNGVGGRAIGIYLASRETQVITEAPFVPSPIFGDDDDVTGTTECTGTETDGESCTSTTKTTTKSSKSSFASSAFKRMTCPARAADNKTCLTYCPATVAQCPQLFTYEMKVLGGLSEYVNGWSFISTGTYRSFRAGAVEPVTGLYLYRVPYNSLPVYRVVQSANKCTNEEIAVNGGQCVKYYQYVTGKFVGFADLYAPPSLPNQPENDTRLTTRSFSRLEDRMKVETDYVSSWRRNGERFDNNSSLSFQIKNYTDESTPNAPAKMICKQFTNTSKDSYFLPTNSDKEIKSFMTAVAKGTVPGVTMSDCTKTFTPWIGYTSCSQVSVGCNSSATIAAERRCMRASAAYADCSECASISDPAPVAGKYNQCFASQICYGSPCPRVSRDCLSAGTKILMADKQVRKIGDIKPGDMVMAFSSSSPDAELTPAKVKTLSVTQGVDLISVNGVKMSENHKVIVKGGNTVEAKDVRSGDFIASASGDFVEVKKVSRVGKKETVYNFEIEGRQGYIADGLRVMASEPMGL